MEVMALMGKIMFSKIIKVRISHKSIRLIPTPIFAQNNTKWLEVLKIILEMCGTAKPINAIGPTNAVMLPAKILVAKISINLVFCIFKPIDFA